MLAFGVPVGKRGAMYVGPVTGLFLLIFLGPLFLMYGLLWVGFQILKLTFLATRILIIALHKWWRARHAAY